MILEIDLRCWLVPAKWAVALGQSYRHALGNSAPSAAVAGGCMAAVVHGQRRLQLLVQTVKHLGSFLECVDLVVRCTPIHPSSLGSCGIWRMGRCIAL